MILRYGWLAVLAAIIVGGATALQGTTLPESYPLGVAPPKAQPLDPGLADWLAQHAERASLVTLAKADFDKALQNHDAVTRALLRLARATHAKDKAEQAAAVKDAFGLIDEAAPNSRSESNNHPLMPFLYYEMSLYEALTPDERAKVLGGIASTGEGSCVQKKRVFDELEPQEIARLSDQGLNDLIRRITSFRSDRFKRNALEKAVRQIPPARRDAVKDSLVAALTPYPHLLRQEKWLAQKLEENKIQSMKEPFKGFYQARDEARRRRCSTAKGHFKRALSHVQEEKATLQEAISVATAIGGCYRYRGDKARLDFWKTTEEPLRQAYGFPGWAESQLQVGYLHWTANDFVQARAVFNKVLEEAKAQDSRKFEGKAVFALARIAENEGNLDEAMTHYAAFAKDWPDDENAEKALMALTLLRVDRGDWKGALGPLEETIAAQDKLKLDDRSIGTMSFALFWAGRAHLVLGRTDLARERWRRLAAEYFSTFYGAMGHYMLEAVTGKKLALQPARTGRFQMHALRRQLPAADRERVRRAEALLKIGQRDDAICEISELDLADGNQEKQVLKALLLSAAGEWLEAIKTFDGLPRTFRQSLPVGFERILFPVRFAETIDNYATRAGVDPDFVRAIIRQESVFNPMAVSSVGAHGLMQLMPATARVEAGRLGKDYLPADRRQKLRQRAQNRRNLFDPETNIAIGVHHVRTLLNKYKSPVFALSAYNANPRAVERWMKTLPTDDLMTFIERIPYSETRAYVKLILRNYFYYKRWYESPKSDHEHLEHVTSSLIAMAKAVRDSEAEATNHH